MSAVRNVLFVMCDQLRRDFVSCYGLSPVPTPNLDRLAARGLRFDLVGDPREQADLGADPRCDAIRAGMRERLFDWLATRKRRTTVTDAEVERRTDAHRGHGIHIGIW